MAAPGERTATTDTGAEAGVLTGRASLPLRAHLAAVLAVALTVALFHASYLRPGLPDEDFPGCLAYFSLFKEALTKGYVAPVWVSGHQSGHSFVLIRPGMGEFYLAAPFSLFFRDDLNALKWAQVAFSVLSAVLFYLFLWKLLRSRVAASVGGVLYALHPVALSFGYLSGHLEFPFFYAVLPVCLLAFQQLSFGMTYRRLLAAVLTLCVLFFIDVERTATALPFLGLFLAVSAFARGRGRPGQRTASILAGGVLVPLFLVGLLFAVLNVWGLAPVLLESKYHQLFEEDVVLRSISTFSFNNIFLLADRMGALVKPMKGHAPDVFTFNDGRFYVGLAAVAVSLTVLAFRRRLRPHPAFYVALAALAGSLWLSFGPHSVCQRTGELLESLLSDADYAGSLPGRELIGLLALTVIYLPGAAFLAWVHRPPDQRQVRRLVLVAAALALLLFTAPYPLVRRYGLLYGHMRGPCYFWASTAPWAAALAAAAAVAALSSALGRWASAGVVAALVAFAAWDLVPYRHYLSATVPKEKVAALDEVARWLVAEGKSGRLLSRESYNPLVDLLAGRGARCHAWGWLNWIATKETGQFYMGRVYPALSRADTFREGLSLAGLGNVRYLVFTLDEGPPPPELPELVPVVRNEYFALCENALCRDFVQVYAVGAVEDGQVHAEEPLAEEGVVVTWERPRPETIAVRVSSPEPCVVVAAESHYPGWTVSVDGVTQGALRVQGAFLGVRVPQGEHVVTFQYRRPWYFAASSLVSVAGGAVFLAFGRRRWRDRLMATVTGWLERLGV